MKSIKIIPVIIGVFMLCSCSRYQFMYMSSNLPQNDKKGFLHENDTCAISYSFSGRNCPITINVYNKLSAPLYVDWEKSAVIINDDKLGLWDDQSGDDHISFIPPQSSVEISPLNLINEFIPLLPEDQIINTKLRTHNGLVTKKRHHYNFDNSPFYFRSFITYSTSKDFITEHYSDDSFWISDIIPTGSYLLVDQPNNFYLEKSTGFSTVMGVTAVAGIIVLLAIIPDQEVVDQ